MSIISTIFAREVEMYLFTHNNIEYKYTSGDKEVTFLNKVYTPTTLKRGNVVSSNDDKQILDIMTGKDNDVVQLFQSLTPSDIKLTIWKASRDDLNTYNQIFNGVVKSCAIKKNEATFKCQPFGSLLSRDISAPSYQSECRHEVYNSRCTLDQADFSVIAQVVSVNPNGIDFVVNTVGGNPDQYFQNGMARTDGNKSRMIIDHTSTSIKIKSPFEFKDEVQVGDNLTLVAGCNYTSDTCKNKFNNFENFNGWEYIPSRNIIKDGL